MATVVKFGESPDLGVVVDRDGKIERLIRPFREIKAAPSRHMNGSLDGCRPKINRPTERNTNRDRSITARFEGFSVERGRTLEVYGRSGGRSRFETVNAVVVGECNSAFCAANIDG